jgi:hypothetical protein
MDDNSPYECGLYLGLLKSFRCFQYELKKFREATLQTDIEDLWKQCVTRSQEVDGYEEKLSADAVDLIKAYVMHSRKS